MSYRDPDDPPAPRRRPRRPRRVVNFYVRIGGYAVAGVVGAALVWALVLKVAHPYRLGFRVGGDIRRTQAALRKQNARNKLLQKRLAYLQTPEGAETEARRAGFARPGEQVYLIRTATPDAPDDAPKEP